jgi:hypothetical protein
MSQVQIVKTDEEGLIWAEIVGVKFTLFTGKAWEALDAKEKEELLASEVDALTPYR